MTPFTQRWLYPTLAALWTTVTVAAQSTPPTQEVQQNRPAPPQSGMAAAVEQLRHVHGRWNVTTDFLQPDGSVARSVQGTYQFDWVVTDRVLSGRSEIPELKQQSGILFYVNEKSDIIQGNHQTFVRAAKTRRP